LGNVVRTGVEGNDHVEQCAAMRELLARHAEWPLSLSVSLAGAEALACEFRADHEGRLGYRLLEYELATRCGWQAAADAADTNVVAALVKLGRYEDALARIRATLDRLSDQGSRNAAYGWNALLGTLLNLGRYDEFRVDVLRAAPAMRRNNMSAVLAENYARLLTYEGRADDAARMIGHIQNTHRASGRILEAITQRSLEFFERKARETLDEATFAARVAEGGDLDDEAADRLVLAQRIKAGTNRL
jgi:tetratricopeptide (TPR) repeat protein